MQTKKILLGLTIAGLLTVGALGYKATTAKAEDTGQTFTDMLVEKFGLDAGEVESAMDDFRTQQIAERQEQMRERMSEKLDEAVSDGVISEDQKQALLDKQTEMQQKRQQLREEWQNWADDSGIDFDALRKYGMHGMGMGLGPGGRGIRHSGGCMW